VSCERITYTSRVDAAPESELNALAAVYRFILDCPASSPVKKKGGQATAPNDAMMKGSNNDDRASTILHSRL
jgi:hypothetical protein